MELSTLLSPRTPGAEHRSPQAAASRPTAHPTRGRSASMCGLCRLDADENSGSASEADDAPSDMPPRRCTGCGRRGCECLFRTEQAADRNVPPLARQPCSALVFIVLQFVTALTYIGVWRLLPELGLDFTLRSKANMYNDGLILALLSVTIFSVGGHFHLFTTLPPFQCSARRSPWGVVVAGNLALYLLSPATAVGFGLLNNVAWLHQSVVSPSAWEPPAVFVYAAVAIILVLLMVRGVVLSCRGNDRGPHCRHAVSEVIVLVLLFVMMFIVPPLALNDFHPHHYQIAFAACLLCSRNTIPDRIAIWILCGVMVHGILANGADPIVIS